MQKIFFVFLMLSVFSNAPAAFSWSGEPASSVNLKNSGGTTVAPRQNLAKGEAGGGGSVPVGFVLAWPASSNPSDADKWLECNGQSISPTAYPELCAVVGSQIPDYRGYFLRGYGGNSASLGYAQGDAIRNITGKWQRNSEINVWTSYMNGDMAGAFYKTERGVTNLSGGSGWKWDINSFNFDASRVVPTASENRPVNKAVRYLIRARP